MPARPPDLIVVGAPKAGTTTLAHWLRAHPDVAFSHVKELEFFDRRYDRGTDWYLAQLPADPGDRCVIEATPTYLGDPSVPARVATDLPGARFVAVLREPVARAWSQYWFFVQLGIEARRWAEVVAQEVSGERTSYLWPGRYGEQLVRWERSVGRERLHVLLTDDLSSDPVGSYADLCRFAGLLPLPPPGRDAVNPTRRPRSVRLQRALQSPHAGRVRRTAYAWNARGRPAPSLPPAEHARLAPHFAEDLVLLERWLGRPLPTRWHPTRP